MPSAIELLRACWEAWPDVGPRPDLRQAAQRLAAGDFPAPPPTQVATELRRQEKPALKALTLPLLAELRAALRVLPADEAVHAWAQTLLRVCEIREATLKKRLATADLTAAQLQQKLQVLAVFFLEYFATSQDARFLNLTCKLLAQRWVLARERAEQLIASAAAPPEAIWATAAQVLLDDALAAISAPDFRPPICLNLAAKIAPQPDKVRAASATGKHVVLFCPNRYSLYTLAVSRLLLDAGVRIDAVVVRKLLNPMRAVSEFRRDGMRLVKKVWTKLVLGRKAYEPVNFPTQLDLLRQLDITENAIEQFAARHGIAVISCKTLNDPAVHRALENYRPDLVVFTGGGLIGEETLARAGAGVVNCHMGQLPQYRGMDVVEWPLIENHAEALGFTVHFMDRGIDTGDVLAIFPVDQSAARTITELRMKFEPRMTRALADTVVGFLNGEVARTPQRQADGRQYFIVHPRLAPIAHDRFAAAIRP